jgi:phosphate uptake regulator
MLDDSEEMLAYVFKVLTTGKKGKKSEKKVYNKDRRINLTEREIRKEVLIHLSTNPKGNIPACLSLISIVKDAERLGDYMKNLFELKDMLKDAKGNPELFKKMFGDSGVELMELFNKVSRAFKESDKVLALEAINLGRTISNRCEEVVKEIIESDDYDAREAVVVSLGARYIKRITIHLTNIVSSVTNPLPELDYITYSLQSPEDNVE